jgi:hemerythrin-like metal-binding protein
MKWRDDYATGVQRIDEDHKMIFKMVEDFRAALDVERGDAVYSVLLETLTLYCRGHFSFEERCMDEYRCPVAEKNKEAHESFLENLSEFQERYAANGFDHTDARRLVDIADQWLDDHICRIDIHLKRCVNK